LAILRSFAAKRPQDPFPRYALAMEHKTAGDHLLAWQTLTSLIADHPDYIAAYAPAAAALCALGRKSEAREVYGSGIAAAERRKDKHARAHLETMLAALEEDG
jgi:Tfp pilus assembly protein PilF